MELHLNRELRLEDLGLQIEVLRDYLAAQDRARRSWQTDAAVERGVVGAATKGYSVERGRYSLGKQRRRSSLRTRICPYRWAVRTSPLSIGYRSWDIAPAGGRLFSTP